MADVDEMARLLLGLAGGASSSSSSTTTSSSTSSFYLAPVLSSAVSPSQGSPSSFYGRDEMRHESRPKAALPFILNSQEDDEEEVKQTKLISPTPPSEEDGPVEGVDVCARSSSSSTRPHNKKALTRRNRASTRPRSTRRNKQNDGQLPPSTSGPFSVDQRQSHLPSKKVSPSGGEVVSSASRPSTARTSFSHHVNDRFAPHESTKLSGVMFPAPTAANVRQLPVTFSGAAGQSRHQETTPPVLPLHSFYPPQQQQQQHQPHAGLLAHVPTSVALGAPFWEPQPQPPPLPSSQQRLLPAFLQQQVQQPTTSSSAAEVEEAIRRRQQHLQQQRDLLLRLHQRQQETLQEDVQRPAKRKRGGSEEELPQGTGHHLSSSTRTSSSSSSSLPQPPQQLPSLHSFLRALTPGLAFPS